MRTPIAPSLPKALLEELGNSAVSAHPHRRTAGATQSKLSRKETRKQGRQERKQRKTDHFTSAHFSGGISTKRHAEEEPPSLPQRKKVKLSKYETVPDVKPITSSSTASSNRPGIKVSSPSAPIKSPLKLQEKKRSRTTLAKLVERSEPFRKTSSREAGKRSVPVPVTFPRSQKEDEDDAYIAYLEAKLRRPKFGKQSKDELEDDGLDELLNDLDTFESKIFSRPNKPVSSDTEHNEDDNSSDSESEEDLNEGEGEHVDINAAANEEEWSGVDDDMEIQQNTPTEITSDNPTTTVIPAKPTPGARYVPPHLRNRGVGESIEVSEDQIKLTRQLNGQLNRMSEQNISSIMDNIEDVYRNHRRHDVTATLTTLIIDGISSHSILLDSYVVLYAAFVSALHKTIGVEFAAYFIQHVVSSYERHFSAFEEQTRIQQLDDSANQSTDGPEGKECSNLIVLISELYNFQVISCVLVYDIIRGLLDGPLTEFRVELLLKITRNSGSQLRTDDPSALKDIIQIVHSKLPGQANALSSRTRFMVETLSNLKNNKIRKAAGQALGGEAVDRMKKFLSGLSKKRQVMAHEPLRVNLDDLHSAESKGKWWLVGAAWGGDPLVDHQERHRETKAVEVDAMNENMLLKLARKQGMNTDIRRSIFVVLMSSDDYVDACGRLSQLKLSEIQQRETIRVILHCCGNEKSYNPYYTLVAQQLCRTSHAHAITLQFCLWDFMRDLGETTVGGAAILKTLQEDDISEFEVKNMSSTRIRNVARAYGWWIAKDCCTVAILKPVDFATVKPQTRTFLTELLSSVFASTQSSAPLLNTDPKSLPKTRNRGPLEEVFIKAMRIQTLTVGLTSFIEDAFRKYKKDDGLLGWASRVALETMRTGIDVSTL